MLKQLVIDNYALIDHLDIGFCGTLNVLTGETGAGKSIILGSLSFLLGDRRSAGVIRSDAEYAEVCGVFKYSSSQVHLVSLLKTLGLEDSSTLTLRRRIRRNGRSTAFAQGKAVSLRDLKSIGALLVDISSQREHQSLLNPVVQRRVVDSTLKDPEVLNRYNRCTKHLRKLEKSLSEAREALMMANRQKEYLSWAVGEIRDANIKEGEEQVLAEKVRMASSFESLHERVNEVWQSLVEQETLTGMKQASRSLMAAGEIDESLLPLASRLESARLEAEDISYTLERYLSGLSFSPEELDMMQQRMAEIQRIRRKYGPGMRDVFDFLEESEHKLEVCEQGDRHITELEDELVRTKAELEEAKENLRRARREVSAPLAERIEEVLHTLGMEQSEFFIEISEPDEGDDELCFMIAANPGLDARPIDEVASGGELSRILLALKSVLHETSGVESVVFDEVDSGIGGSVANAVGEKLTLLASRSQVIVITHLASIAAKADCHLLVEKSIENNNTTTSVSLLSGEKRQREVARMLTGDQSSVTLLHAQQLLKS